MSVASLFNERIAASSPTPHDIATRRWIYIPYDRFTDRVGPLTEQPASETGIVIVESTAKAHRRPYHKKKLVLLISNMRHFALEQAGRGVKVLYHFSPLSHGEALRQLQQQLSLPTLIVTQPAERELRLDLASAVAAGLCIDEVLDQTWLSTTEHFTEVYGPYTPGKSYVMDAFYRRQRQRTGILMEGGRPSGGRYSFDAENRKPYKNQVKVPRPPAFPPDDITLEVIDHIARTYPHHFGDIEGFNLPTSQADADTMWHFALNYLLPVFGPYEDAMRGDQPQLFHSRTSALVNLGRLLPIDLLHDVEHAAQLGRIPPGSAEGFIRQLLGWREFMRHVHQQTDGYRLVPVPRQQPPSLQRPSPDATAPTDTYTPPDSYAGAIPSALGASLPLPAAYWGVPSGLHCLDTVVADVVHEGWSHHITRLMVLANLANLCGFSPRELTDWFWFGYVDAYDWVVEPNVLGMATYADGGVTATKPYVSGAAYINRMSNFCTNCQYDPKKSTGPGSCPFTALYWTFLERNADLLGMNPRLQMPYRTLRSKPATELVQLRTRAEQAVAHLQSFPRPEY